MHRTESKDPEFSQISYGEIWVRVYDTSEDPEDTEPTWRHFHVSPQSSEARMTVAEAVANVETLNSGEEKRAHRFEYYAVEVTVERTVATPETVETEDHKHVAV